MNDSTSNYHVFMNSITGGVSAPVIAASIVFALMGLLLITLLNIQKGIKQNPNTASKFTWQDFGLDSFIRVFISMIITLIVIFISIRFSNEFFGTPLTMAWSFIVGLSIDKATIMITRLSKNIKTSK